MVEEMPSHAIAIVGIAGRFPGCSDLDDIWRMIREGDERLESIDDLDMDAAGVPLEVRAHPDYVKKTTSLAQPEHFDAAFFGISPREAQVIDPQQRLFLECAWEAIEHAGYAGAVAGQSVGVFGGCSMNSYLGARLYADPALMASVGPYQLMLGNDKDFLCTRVAYKLDLRGPAYTVQTACSTSLVAVHVACRALHRGECDMALAGGASILFPHRSGYLYQQGMIFSPDGHCRPFDVDARGTRAGSGAGVVLLKRLADAIADRDTIYAVIRGSAINNDGSGKAGFTAPSVDGQMEVIVTAQELAGVDPRTISYVEAHGTATPLGDPIEIAALTEAFRAYTEDVGFCRLGSLKANLGHLDGAAGVAGLIKATLALRHAYIPPLVNFRSPNPQLNLDTSPFSASAQGSDWRAGEEPRRAGVSSFGIGGTNAHVVLEEAPAQPPVVSAGERLLLLSARSEAALDKMTANLAAHLRAHPELSLADVEWTLMVGRSRFAHRRALVARDATQALALLDDPQGKSVVTATVNGAARQVAFLFSGQGSQHAGMGAGLYESEPIYRAAIDCCATLLRSELGLDLREVLFGGQGAQINETRIAQPALFVTSYAIATLWKHWGVVPAATLGHSIGEYMSAHLAGVLSLEDALKLVALRGRLMHEMDRGAMAAVHLSAAELRPKLTAGLEIAAENAPNLCTVSGTSEAMRCLLEQLQQQGVDARALPVSHAFHSAMMEPMLDRFEAAVRQVKLSAPALPYVSNLTGNWITREEATSPRYYAQHLRGAVLFAQGVAVLAAEPSMLLLEVGPGTALATLASLSLGSGQPGRCLASQPHPQESARADRAMLSAAGRLWAHGVELDWTGMRNAHAPRRVGLPTYPFERSRFGPEVRRAPMQPLRMAAATVAAEPNGEAAHSTAATHGPVNELEEHVSGLFCDIVGIAAPARRMSFFELGGHSLQAVQLLSRLRQDFDVELTMADFLDEPSIAGVATTIERRLTEAIGQMSEEEVRREMEGLGDDGVGNGG